MGAWRASYADGRWGHKVLVKIAIKEEELLYGNNYDTNGRYSDTNKANRPFRCLALDCHNFIFSFFFGNSLSFVAWV